MTDNQVFALWLSAPIIFSGFLFLGMLFPDTTCCIIHWVINVFGTQIEIDNERTN